MVAVALVAPSGLLLAVLGRPVAQFAGGRDFPPARVHTPPWLFVVGNGVPMRARVESGGPQVGFR